MSTERKKVVIKRKMPVNDLMGSFSSKSSFYSYLKEQLQYYMPPYTMVTAPFLKQVLKSEKRLLKIKDVIKCNPPKYDEISVAKLYADCIQLPGMVEHFPDVYPKGRTCSRE